MKKTLAYGFAALATIAPFSFNNLAVADDSAQLQNGEVQTSTSHNPITNTTTTTIERKSTRKHKRSDGKEVVREHHLKVKKKAKDDGSKTSVTSEESNQEKTE